MNKNEVIKNTYNAFEFIEKLYLECTYLIKEIEGILAQEPEEFIIGRPSGYQISSRKSNGLEPINVNYWMTKGLAIFFILKNRTTVKGGMTHSKIEKDNKVIYIRISLHEPEYKQPEMISGVLYEFEKLSEPKKWPGKIEALMQHFEYSKNKFLATLPDVNYEDSYVRVKGKFLSHHLFDINSSDEIKNKVIDPALELFRKV